MKGGMCIMKKVYLTDKILKANWSRLHDLTEKSYKDEQVRAEAILRLMWLEEFENNPKEVLRKIMQLNDDIRRAK